MSRNHGFTILELIVVMGIVILLVTASVSSYNSFNDRQRLKQAGLTLKSSLRLAQTKAIGVMKPASPCTQLVGYSVSFASASYTTNPVCTIEGTINEPSAVNLPSSVTFLSPPASFTFTALTGRVNGASTDTQLVLVSFAKKYTLVIHSNGDIDDNGIANYP